MAKYTLETEPTFPPLLSGRAVHDGQSAFANACAAGVGGGARAGDVFWSKSQDVLDVAIVLEPECAEAEAQQMLFATMVAFGDSFGAIAPPEIGVHYQWPNGFRISGASIGRARIAIGTSGDDGVPRWMVVGLEVRIRPYDTKIEPGHDLLKTTLWDEGAGELDATMLISSFSRHFLTWVNNWTEDGFQPVHSAWLARALGRDELCEFAWQGKKHKGRFLSIDDEGNLLLKEKKTTVSLPLEPVIERPDAGR